MLRLMRFELSKIMKTKFNRILLLLLFLFLIGFYVFVYEKTVRPEEVAIDRERIVNSMEERIEEIKLSSGDELSKSEKQEIEIFENILERDRRELEGYLNEDWEAVLNVQIELAPRDLESRIKSRQYYTSSFSTLFTDETRRELHKYLRDHQITPVLPLDSLAWYTVYDELYPISGSDHDDFLKEFVHKRANKFSSTGVGYIENVSKLLFSLYGIAVFILLFGDVVTREGIGRYGPIHLLRTQPVHKDSILISKFLSILTTTILILIGLGGTSLLLGTIFDRFGDWRYPVLVYGEDYAYEFIATSTYLLKSAALFLMVLVFSYALLFLYSIVAKRMIIAVGLTLATILLGVQLGNEAIETGFSHWIPFHYLNTTTIVTMEKAASLKNFNFDFANGMIVLGVSSMILLGLTYGLSFWQNRYKGA